ncbi:MAG TPA: hypothetical protein VNU71_13320 [Burkholderiaceae bacterium]|nr:hypothetical protein [Burkholderiaceae bacterium]
MKRSNVGPILKLSPPPAERNAAPIGIGWRPGHIVKRDDAAGTYSEMNPPLDSRAERDLQAALLSPVRFKFSVGRIEAARNAKRVKP